MTDSVAGCFEKALKEVDRARRAGLITRDGSFAADRLRALRAALESERDLAVARGSIDVAAVGALVREVVEWYPEDQVRLIVALGALARAGSTPVT
jgi:hypothetical protein